MSTRVQDEKKRLRPMVCKGCGRAVDRLSRNRRLCPECSRRRAEESQRQLKAKSGEFYEKWKKAISEAMRK